MNFINFQNLCTIIFNHHDINKISYDRFNLNISHKFFSNTIIHQHHRTSYTTFNASLHQASTTTITKPPQPPAAGTPTTVYQVAGFQQVARLRTNGLVDYRLYPSPASPFSIVLSSFSSIRISTPPTRLKHTRECRAKDRHQRSSFKISIVSRRCSRKS